MRHAKTSAKIDKSQFTKLPVYVDLLLKNYNLGHNISRLFDVLPNFPFTTSETNQDY